MGEKAWLVSAVGDDSFGKEAVKQVKSLGINTEYVSVLGEKQTGKCLVELNENAVPSYNLLDDVAYDYIKVPRLKEKADIISFGTLSLRHLHNREALLQILKENSFSEVFADVNIRAPFYSEESIVFCLENATVLKISDEELPVITNVVFGKNLSVEAAAKELSKKYNNLKIIVVTKGKEGSCCYNCKTDEFFSVKSEKVNVVSTVGAGDSFGAAFVSQFF